MIVSPLSICETPYSVILQLRFDQGSQNSMVAIDHIICYRPGVNYSGYWLLTFSGNSVRTVHVVKQSAPLWRE
jgi:hypothetical protein